MIWEYNSNVPTLLTNTFNNTFYADNNTVYSIPNNISTNKPNNIILLTKILPNNK